MTSTSAGVSRSQASPSQASRPDVAPADEARQKAASRSPLAQLLHALNQPLTGLQCSMEVALGRPRTHEQYVRGLRQGLELTGRMRALVEAIREVVEVEAEVEEDRAPQTERTALASLLQDAVNELSPVAEAKNVRLALTLEKTGASSSGKTGSGETASGETSSGETELAMTGKQPALARVIFRLLDSTLSMARPGTALRIEAGSGTGQAGIRIEWQAEGPRSAFSRPELGLLIVQARLERAGAEWERKTADNGNDNDNGNDKNDNMETLNIRLPRFRGLKRSGE
jgi:signal transduction histidine kinase